MQIKTQTTLRNRLSALALAAILSVSACAELDATTWWASPVGITLDQTARLTFANVGEPRGIVVDWRFIDADGVIVARSKRPLTIPFGKMVSVDLDRDTLPQPEARVQIRAEVEVLTPGNPNKNLSSSLEVFDNDTGKTTVFVIAII
jgi:hypothetical protein